MKTKSNIVTIIIILIISLFYVQPTLSKNKDSFAVLLVEDQYHISLPVNTKHIKHLNQVGVSGKEHSSINQIIDKNIQVNLSLSLEPLDNGEYRTSLSKIILNMGQKTYKINGNGIFIEFTSPDTGNKYYFGQIEGNLEMNNKNQLNRKLINKQKNSWMVAFSVEDDKAYLQTGIKLKEYQGILAFGKWFMTKDYWKSLSEQKKSQL